MSTPPPRILVVSASDSRFMRFLRDMIGSIQPFLARPHVDLACFDIGLDPADRRWLESLGAEVRPPGAHLGQQAADHSPALRSFLARPFLREYFPGYDVYVWLDSDIWLQDAAVLDQYVDGALRQGLAVTHEEERGYRFQAWLFGWNAKHFVLGYGPLVGAYLLARPHVNAGFFALAADAPHWDAWARRYQAAIGRTGKLVPHDQFALNHALHARGAAPACLLDPGCNWICERGVPMWNDDEAAFCRPYAPYRPIGALHLAGPGKRTVYDIRRTGGGGFRTMILRGASPTHPIVAPPTAALSQAEQPA